MGLIEKIGDMAIEAEDKLANFPTIFDVSQNDVSGEYGKEYGEAVGRRNVLREILDFIEKDAKPKWKKGRKKNV